VRYVAGDGPLEDRDGLSWYRLKERVEAWLREVRTDLEMPDRWAELKQVAAVLGTAQSDGASNAPFTADEQAEISRQLDEIKNIVRANFELTSEQFAVIDKRLDEAKEASERVGRKDWVLIFYGAVMSTLMTDAVPPGVIQTVLATMVHGIAHIFGLGGPSPIITA
jgi:hypothetical protein